MLKGFMLKGPVPKRLMPNLPVWLFSLVRWPSPETTEWFNLRAALWWVVLLWPSLHLFAANPSFSSLERWAGEGTWQIVMGAALVAQCIAVCVGNRWGRVGALAAFGMIWAFIAVQFWTGSPHICGIPRNTGVGLYSALSCDCYAVAIHLVRLWYIDRLARQAHVSASMNSADLSPVDASPAGAHTH